MERDITKRLKNRRLTEVITGMQGSHAVASAVTLNPMDTDDTISDITDFSEMEDSFSSRSTQTSKKSLLEEDSEDEKEIFENYSELWKYDQESFMIENHYDS